MINQQLICDQSAINQQLIKDMDKTLNLDQFILTSPGFLMTAKLPLIPDGLRGINHRSHAEPLVASSDVSSESLKVFQ